MSDPSAAIALAATAHAGQVDKAGQPYILHPLRVMAAVRTNEERIVAVLHDVIEDTDLTPQRLKELGFGDSIEALDRLTRRPNETYAEFVERAAGHPVSRKVKIADIEDNLSPARAASCTPHLRDRYEKALARLRVSPVAEMVRISQELDLP